ncbi:aldo/keto reductase [Tepidibacillus marianensis]|uniref:aldo/keto reductase n=1 Tax=Tepidibacillus marianensis TaxID=3131995 RepID=UPI0030CBAC22
MLAETFSGKRDQLIIATKGGYDIYTHNGERTGHSELPQDWRSESLRRSLEGSLRRLNTDYIDLYQLHNTRMSTIQSDSVKETLERFKEEGKIRYYGVALGPDLGWEQEGIAAIDKRKFDFVQIINNILEQDPARSFFPYADKNDTSLIVRVPHASGLLDGSYDPDKHFDKSDHRNHRPIEWMKAGLEVVRELKPLYEGTDRTIGQLAILFSLARPSVKSVLPNITNEKNLKEFSEASDRTPLSEAGMSKIESLWTNGYSEKLAQPFANSEKKPAKQVG